MYTLTFYIYYAFFSGGGVGGGGLTDMYMCLYLDVHLGINRPIRMTTSLSVHTFCVRV